MAALPGEWGGGGLEWVWGGRSPPRLSRFQPSAGSFWLPWGLSPKYVSLCVPPVVLPYGR